MSPTFSSEPVRDSSLLQGSVSLKAGEKNRGPGTAVFGAGHLARWFGSRCDASVTTRYDLDGHRTPWTRAVEFYEEDALPRAQHQAALVYRDHEVASNDPGGEMGPRIVVHTVMPILGLRQQIADNCFKVSLQTGLVFVDEDARGCMQTEDAANTFLNAGFRHGVVKVAGDVQHFGGLRGRNSNRLHSSDFTIPHDSRRGQRRRIRNLSAYVERECGTVPIALPTRRGAESLPAVPRGRARAASTSARRAGSRTKQNAIRSPNRPATHFAKDS